LSFKDVPSFIRFSESQFPSSKSLAQSLLVLYEPTRIRLSLWHVLIDLFIVHQKYIFVDWVQLKQLKLLLQLQNVLVLLGYTDLIVFNWNRYD